MIGDIVAELDRWLERDLPGDDRGTLRRARDEIVALREANAEARAEAWAQGFEAAKRVVILMRENGQKLIANAIRNQGDEM